MEGMMVTIVSSLARMENKLDSEIACIQEVKAEIKVIKEGNKDVKDKIVEVKR